SPERARQSANSSASWREGRRTPCSIFLIVSTAQKACCANASWVRSRALLSRRKRRPNDMSRFTICPSDDCCNPEQPKYAAWFGGTRPALSSFLSSLSSNVGTAHVLQYPQKQAI